jgi:hypothetical protein
MLQHSIQLHIIEYVMLVTYLLFVLGIGLVFRRTIAPLVLLGPKDVGGWDGLVAKLVKPPTDAGFAPGTLTESWSHTGSASANPMGVEWFGLAMGLGFVLSFG